MNSNQVGEVFDSIDTAGSGILDRSKLGVLLRELGGHPTNQDLVAAFFTLDHCGNGNFSKESFLKYYQAQTQGPVKRIITSSKEDYKKAQSHFQTRETFPKAIISKLPPGSHCYGKPLPRDAVGAGGLLSFYAEEPKLRKKVKAPSKTLLKLTNNKNKKGASRERVSSKCSEKEKSIKQRSKRLEAMQVKSSGKSREKGSKENQRGSKVVSAPPPTKSYPRLQFDWYTKDTAASLITRQPSTEISNKEESRPVEAVTMPPGVSCIVNKVRAQLRKQGARGLVALGRLLNGKKDSNTLSLAEVKVLLRAVDNKLTEKDIRSVFEHLELNESPSLLVGKFLNNLRNPMNSTRLEVVKSAFESIDDEGNEAVSFDQVRRKLNTQNDPMVIAGFSIPEDVLSLFLENFRDDCDPVATISKREFIEHYHFVSSGVTEDDQFEATVRQEWNLETPVDEKSKSDAGRPLADKLNSHGNELKTKKTLRRTTKSKVNVAAINA